jgi:hypothetical protein
MIGWSKRVGRNFGIFRLMVDVTGTGVRRSLGAGQPG